MKENIFKHINITNFSLQLDQLMTHQAVMEEQFKSLRRLMYVIFVLLIGVLFAMILTVNNLTSLVMDGKKSSSIEL